MKITMRRNAIAASIVASGIAVAGAAVPASAATTDAELHATAQSGYTAACSYSADVKWDRASDYITGSVSVTNHNWFSACRKTLLLTFVDDENSTYDVSIVIDTACATMDPTGPSRIDLPLGRAAGVNHHIRPFIDHISARVVDRLP